MARFIDADKIISHLNDEIEACGDCDVYSKPVVYGTRLGLEYSKSLVETAETADVQEIKHGTWRESLSDMFPDGTDYRCSVCGRTAIIDSKYCPNCGAKMDLEDE